MNATYRHSPSITPYNTGKVLIGGAYVPPPAHMSRDAETVQRLLLGSQPRTGKTSKLTLYTCIGTLLALVLIAIVR